MPSKTIIAIVCITILLGLALFKDIDGILLSSGLTLLAGLGGYAIGRAKSPK